MTRLCERPGCSERGAIAYGFDPDRLLVWLAPFDPAAERMRSGVLCLRHGDAMVVPVGWTLDDARDPGPKLFSAPRTARAARPPRRRATPRSAPEQLSLVEPPLARSAPVEERPAATVEDAPPVERTVAAVTGVAAAAEVDPDATVAIPWSPDFDESDDLNGVLAADTPLLARAFRRSTPHQGLSG